MAQSHVVRVYNRSKQMVALQACPPGGDFYINESQVRLSPGQHVLLPKSHLNWDQIKNLQAKQILQVTYDSQALEEAKEAAAAQE